MSRKRYTLNAILFYVSLGFVNQKIQIDKETNEKEYIMEWRASLDT